MIGVVSVSTQELVSASRVHTLSVDHNLTNHQFLSDGVGIPLGYAVNNAVSSANRHLSNGSKNCDAGVLYSCHHLLTIISSVHTIGVGKLDNVSTSSLIGLIEDPSHTIPLPVNTGWNIVTN
ncbi:MAG: hypothetical protein NZZ41_02750 [Candidatus Dojkabacteria bacterium]|nr:hypothetical protein [Candidatus Dojkabacteria bacterium]